MNNRRQKSIYPLSVTAWPCLSLALSTTVFNTAHAQQLPPPVTSDKAGAEDVQILPTPRAMTTPRLIPARKAATSKPMAAEEESRPAWNVLPAPATTESQAKTPADDNGAVIIISPELPVYQMPPRERPQTKPQVKPTPRRKSPVATKVAKHPTVKVHGIDVSHGSEAVAVARVRHALLPLLNTPIRLSDGVTEHTVRRGALGVTIPEAALVRIARSRQAMGQSVNVPLRFSVNSNVAQSTLRQLARQVNQNATPAQLDLNAAGQVQMRGRDSVELAVAGSAQRIKQAIEANPTTTRIELVVKRAPYGGSKGVAQSTLSQFRYLLAAFSTPYDANIRGRTNNLRMSAKLVDGTIVPAGAIFSANQSIGPRTAAAGWREAKMFVDGQVVDGVGAGICQCSTTIYNAALLAGLPIVERHPHSFRVTYAPASRDAAIYWGQKDMRFRNNTNGPIYVQTFLRGGRFYARLYGTQAPPSNVRVESRVLSRANGTRSEAYRVRQTSSGTIRERLSRDYYKPKPN
jgi:vancomycin resistance protein YoaR